MTSYYGLPLLKPPVWTWEVPTYFFVGGAAGAAAVIGIAARLAGADEKLVRDARFEAFGPAGRHKAMSYDRMKQEEKKLESEIAELLEQAERTDREEDQEYGSDKRGDELPSRASHSFLFDYWYTDVPGAWIPRGRNSGTNPSEARRTLSGGCHIC